MVKIFKWFLEENSRRLPFRYSPGSQVASAEALQDYFLSSFVEHVAPFELPSHFIPSLDLKSCTQVQRPGELKTSDCKKGSRETASGEGKWLHNHWHGRGLGPRCANTAHPSAGNSAGQGFSAFIPSPLVPCPEHPNALGPSAFHPAWMSRRVFEGSLWRDVSSQETTFSLSPTEGQSCGCICNTPRFCTCTSA